MTAGPESTYVVCWRPGGLKFACPESWEEAREIFEARARGGERGLEALRACYGGLTRPGAALAAEAVEIHHAVRLGGAAGASDEALLLAAASPTLSVVGPRARLQGLLSRLKERGVGAELFLPAAEDELWPVRQPPSEAQPSLRARRAAEGLAGGDLTLAAVRRELSVAELLYVGYELRRAKRAPLARAIAEALLGTGHTTGRLNLLGAALRDLGFFDHSERVYRESLALCDLAEENPYGFVGLGATLRRLGRPEEAYDFVKRARRFYPDDRYVIETLEAILRDLARTRERPFADAA